MICSQFIEVKVSECAQIQTTALKHMDVTKSFLRITIKYEGKKR